MPHTVFKVIKYSIYRTVTLTGLIASGNNVSPNETEKVFLQSVA